MTVLEKKVERRGIAGLDQNEEAQPVGLIVQLRKALQQTVLISSSSTTTLTNSTNKTSRSPSAAAANAHYLEVLSQCIRRLDRILLELQSLPGAE